MKKRTTAKKAAKKAPKKPVSFDDVVDSVPGSPSPVSRANPVLAALEQAVGALPGSVFGQLGGEVEEEEGWESGLEELPNIKTVTDPNSGASFTFDPKSPQEGVMTIPGTNSQPEPETQLQTPPDAGKQALEPFSREWNVQTLSNLMKGMRWMYKRKAKRLVILPEQDAELHAYFRQAERLLEHLSK